jgi:ferric-dicitrate binding protein FerR (iron transport regulator)
VNKDFNIQHLVSYLSGNCSKTEQEMVKEWISLSDDNMLLFEDFKKVWDTTTVENEVCKVDINKSWDKFKVLANFEEDVVLSHPKSVNRGFIYYATRIAALFLVSFGIYFLFNSEKTIETVKYSSVVEKKNSAVVLPDGSKVTVKNGVEMDYPISFASNTRDVNFRGEAFFEVVSNPEKPMIIAADNVRVKVLGTAFSLSNIDDNDEITVYLESGKVSFYSVDEEGNILEQIILKPHQKGVYNKVSGLITKNEVTDNNHIAWKTGALEFVQAPLTDVIDVLEHTYDININSKSDLGDLMLTARFDNETPESILESLKVIYGFKYEIRGNIVSIY